MCGGGAVAGGLWTQMKEQFIYLLKGPGSTASSVSPLLPIPPSPPAFRSSYAFEAHVQEAGRASASHPQAISLAWDEREQFGDQQPGWQGLSQHDRKSILLDLYLQIAACSSAVDAIARRIFSGGFVVEKVDQDGPDNREHFDLLNEFLLRINPDWDFNQLGRSLIQDYLIYGECYGEMTWKNGQPWQLYKADCIPMGFYANKYGQIEQFYQEMPSSRKRNLLDPRTIIRWWSPHPRTSVDPFAPIEKVSDASLIDKKMMLWMISFFQKGAKFNYYFKGVADRDEADRFLTFFKQNFMGEKNAHIPPITWGNAEIAPLGNQGPLQMDFDKGMDKMEVTIYGAYGVPPASVSIIQTGAMGGHSEQEQDKMFVFNACDPAKQAFFEKINDRVTKRGFGITDYRISAKYADYRSDKDMATTEDIRIKNGSRTVDEIRMESGKKPYAQGGSVPFIWSTKEVVPLARLEDLEDEQRENAQVALQTAQANADLAATKAKQAKEPAQQAPVPGNNQTRDEKNQANDGKKPGNDEKKQQESYSATDAMIALMIPPEIGQQIALPDGEAVEDLHLMLAYLGDVTALQIDLALLAAALQTWASAQAPLAGRIAGCGRFDAPEGEPIPLIALPDIPGLPEARQSLVQCLQMLGIDANGEHGYTPHITLKYQDASLPMPAFEVPHLDLFFDSICLAIGKQRTFFPLLGQKQEAQLFTGKTELPQWTDPEEEALLAGLAQQGVTALTWEEGPNPCRMCLMNRGVTVKLGDPFPSGHRTPQVHPHCDCNVRQVYQAQEEEDRDATQKLPVVRKQTALPLTEADTWEGRG
jgi:2'-5' RNA ligase